MEFLVSIEIPPLSKSDRAAAEALVDAERQAGRRLIEQGVLMRIWRLPGRWASILLMSVDDANHLDDAIATLPLKGYAEITVTPLARHPLERTSTDPH